MDNHGSWTNSKRESAVNEFYQKNSYMLVVNRLYSILFKIDNIIYYQQNSIGARLEDLKKGLAKPYLHCVNGWVLGKKIAFMRWLLRLKWWGDQSSPDFAPDGMNPFGKTSINRKTGSIFSESDQYILQTLFYPFCVRFGYVKTNAEQFEIDLQMIRPMLDNMFDFEKAIA